MCLNCLCKKGRLGVAGTLSEFSPVISCMDSPLLALPAKRIIRNASGVVIKRHRRGATRPQFRRANVQKLKTVSTKKRAGKRRGGREMNYQSWAPSVFFYFSITMSFFIKLI